MLTFPVILAKAGIQVPLEADIASILGSSLRQSDETGLLSCLIIKCQHYLVYGNRHSDPYNHQQDRGTSHEGNGRYKRHSRHQGGRADA